MKKIVSSFYGILLAFVSFQTYASTQSIPTKPSDWGTVSVKTTAEHTFKNQFASYARLSALTFLNCGTVLYTAPHDGELKIIANTAKEELEVVIFRAESSNLEQELTLGNAFLLAHKTVAKGENFSVDKSSSYDLHEATRFQILKGQNILIFVNSKTATTLDFTPELTKSKALEARNKVAPFEFRKNKAGKSLKIVIRDAVTGLPVKARVNIQGLKGLENIYNGSDLTFDLITGKAAVISCDADGYFKADFTPKFVAGVDNVVTILLTSFDINENMRLEGVQFKEGTAEPMPTAFKDMDKLVDFMKINTSIKIEVGGHVNAPDGQSRAAEKLSKQRAKFVRDYLVQKGIDASRVSYEGYGNSMMIYENPQNEQEEQANRRVEIKFFD